MGEKKLNFIRENHDTPMDLEVHSSQTQPWDAMPRTPHLFQLLQRFGQHHQARQPQVQVAAEVQAALLLVFLGSRFWTQKMNHSNCSIAM